MQPWLATWACFVHVLRVATMPRWPGRAQVKGGIPRSMSCAPGSAAVPRLPVARFICSCWQARQPARGIQRCSFAPGDPRARHPGSRACPPTPCSPRWAPPSPRQASHRRPGQCTGHATRKMDFPAFPASPPAMSCLRECAWAALAGRRALRGPIARACDAIIRLSTCAPAGRPRNAQGCDASACAQGQAQAWASSWLQGGLPATSGAAGRWSGLLGGGKPAPHCAPPTPDPTAGTR